MCAAAGPIQAALAQEAAVKKQLRERQETAIASAVQRRSSSFAFNPAALSSRTSVRPSCTVRGSLSQRPSTTSLASEQSSASSRLSLGSRARKSQTPQPVFRDEASAPSTARSSTARGSTSRKSTTQAKEPQESHSLTLSDLQDEASVQALEDEQTSASGQQAASTMDSASAAGFSEESAEAQAARWEEFHRRSGAFLQDREELLILLRRKKEVEELQGCTFEPQISKSSQEKGRRRSSSSLYHRGKQREAWKEEKLEAKRRELEKQEMAECSFRPAPRPPRIRTQPSAPPAMPPARSSGSYALAAARRAPGRHSLTGAMADSCQAWEGPLEATFGEVVSTPRSEPSCPPTARSSFSASAAMDRMESLLNARGNAAWNELGYRG